MNANPYKLAASLARPVTRGWLSQDDAEDSLLITALRSRSGHDPLDVYRIARHILTQKLADMHAKRELAAHHIKRQIEPMIGSRKPWRALMAESHGINGEEGFPLAEDEVGEIVRDEVWWSLRPEGAAMDDPIRDAYEAGKPRPRLAYSSEESRDKPREAFELNPIRIVEPRSIPHRQWLYGNRLIRGFVTLLVAPGGTGKSSLLLGMCMAMATHRALLGARIHQRCNVALLNLEDPQDEIDRRVTALAMRYGITNDDLAGRFFVSPPGRGVNIAASGGDGFSVVHPDEKQIIERINDEKIDVLAVDPFAESHTLEENSNPQMIQAAAAWRRVARAGNCAVILAHHVRKGPVDSIESARGAKALTDSARVGLLLSTMSEEDAEALGITTEQRLQYVRLDDAKANMAPRAPKATWFHLDTVTLDNADDTYDRGDEVVVIETWEPPNAGIGNAPSCEINLALDAIAAGPQPGILYTRTKRGDSSRWCGQVLCDAFQITEKEAASWIAKWCHTGLLFETEYMHPKWRRKTTGMAVREHERPT